MARQERAERTRNVILDAAAEAFDEYGFVGASLSDILATAGVTKGALYFHFSSKEELASALIEEQFSVWGPFAATDRPGLQTVIDLTHNMAMNLMLSVRVRAAIRLVIEHGSFASPAIDAYRSWTDLVERCMVAAQATGDLRKEVQPDDLAMYVIGSFTGVQLRSQVLTGRADVRQRVTDMWQFLLPGIVPPRRLTKFNPTGTVDYEVAASA
ncbi:TetR family transcriptional regulator [Herbihabitans rhizosphaerae]|uniref:TetR family transcriptional regulator n=1 Tax=Herbihabitans rhizosphaerae TaxID=1872711 RepID=A0A4Q7KJ35_9PSEU|nr:ScbR family autoregulator-binding transcription factor [Herbihabitans rhizosphaerae]RZS36578.1 TetR family transcriptional regulator [Herbihabitans rhizosphaerae]